MSRPSWTSPRTSASPTRPSGPSATLSRTSIPEIVDCESAGDVVTLTLRGGKRCVVNTQRPARQIWLAANARAWHFSWDAAGARWMDDKGHGDELFATLSRIVKEATGADVRFG